MTADPQARRNNGLANVPPTTGDLRIPMLTLHTLGDLFVPFRMEQVYAARVAANGASDKLVQRATRDFGHCSFTAPELVHDLLGPRHVGRGWREARGRRRARPGRGRRARPSAARSPTRCPAAVEPAGPRLPRASGLSWSLTTDSQEDRKLPM